MRPYIEFIQSQQLEWTAAPAVFGGAHWKLLSRDEASGAVTALLRFAARTTQLAPRLAVDWECFVLQGAASIGELSFATHYYAYLPAGQSLGRLQAPHETILLSFFRGDPQPAPDHQADRDLAARLIAPVDTTAMRWDSSGMDPNINHLNAARKNLRFAPEGDCRSYLLGGMPQGFPPTHTPLETHPHVEEFFMVSGDMSVHCGIMRAGAYFWRPPGIPHGRDCTRSGFLLFCRTPGSNRTVSEWSRERYSVSFTPAHRPVLPANLSAAGAAPVPDPIVY
jgi:hypothetical protein